MFGKIAKKIIDDTKETLKEEVKGTLDKKKPLILSTIVTGVTLLCLSAAKKDKISQISEANITIVNNHYYYNR